MIHEQALFAAPLFDGVIEGYQEHRSELLAHIEALRSEHPSQGRSMRKGWHSGPALMSTPNPALVWLLKQILNFSARALAARYDNWAKYELRLGSFWAMSMQAGAYSAPHHHLPQLWSGVFYAQLPASASGGEIEFVSPVVQLSTVGVHNQQVVPEEGMVLLFPSALVHHVHPHDGAQRRVSVAFNLRLVTRS